MGITVNAVETDVLPTYKRGDTLPAILVKPEFRSNNVDVVIPPIGTIVSAWMQFRSKYGKVLAEFRTSDNTLEIVDADNWCLKSVPRVITTQYVGHSDWDLEVLYIDSHDSLEKTLTIAAGTMPIAADVTRDVT